MKLEICVTLGVNHLAFLGCVELNCYYSYYHHHYYYLLLLLCL